LPNSYQETVALRVLRNADELQMLVAHALILSMAVPLMGYRLFDAT